MRRAALAVAAIVLAANTTGFAAGHPAGHHAAQPPQRPQSLR